MVCPQWPSLALYYRTEVIASVGALVLKLPADILAPFLHRISNLKPTHSVDSSVAATALRTFITAFPLPQPRVQPSKKTQDAYSAISKVLIPRLLGYVVIPQGLDGLPAPPAGLLEIGQDRGVNSDALDVLIEIVRCFGPMLDDREKQALQKTVIAILDDDTSGSMIKKKAVVAISLLAIHLPDRLLSNLLANVTENFRSPTLTLSRRRLYFNVVGSFSKLVPHRLGPHLKTLAPFILSALSSSEFERYEQDAAEDGAPNPDVDEVREAALVALEGFLSSCVKHMVPFTAEAIDSSVRFVGYDPMTTTNEDDEEMSGTQDDDEEVNDDNGDDAFNDEEDFEEEGALSDDDDSSWKIRRCAVKILYALISTRSNGDLLENGILYEKIAPVLVNRFKEREENVRLEVLTTMSSLVRKTGEGVTMLGPSALSETDLPSDISQRSRKRRRVDSNTDTFDASNTLSSTVGLMSPATSPSPVSGSRADLARLSPAIVRGVAKLLKQSSVPTKRAAIILLRDVVVVQNGGLTDHLNRIAEPIVEAVKGHDAGPNGSSAMPLATSATGTGSRMRIEALELVSAICDTHSSKILSPYIDSIVPSVIVAMGDRNYKVSGEALLAAESVIKALTPPRAAGTDQQRKTFLKNIYDAILPRASASDADLEVRRRAIYALGVLLARTRGPAQKLLGSDKRSEAMSILQDRLMNETTRISAIKAVDLITSSASDPEDFQNSWLKQVSIELAAQLRKADRQLRNTSLTALRNLLINSYALQHLDNNTVHSLAEMMLPILGSGDLNAMAVAMTCLNKLVEKSPNNVADENLNEALCKVTLSPLATAISEPYLSLIESIGVHAVGKQLMQGLLQDVGVAGDPAIVGKAIGTLLVSAGNTLEVSLDDFVKELKTSKDPQRKCLALSILGEAGFRLGASSPLEPQLFSSHFTSKSDSVPRAAAIALGRAGAGNVSHFLPLILQNAAQIGQLQYLSLHSIKEILQFGGQARGVIAPFTKDIWEKLLQASQAEGSKVICAECLGRIAVIEPAHFLPILQVRD